MKWTYHQGISLFTKKIITGHSDFHNLVKCSLEKFRRVKAWLTLKNMYLVG